ncbi:MAG: hypothetical protein N3A65_02400 [candidate division WOR-3 bacterium]|nr:hypothetical protein [candidate division WOR-3 bacterium]
MVPIFLLVITWFDWKVLKTGNFTIIYKPGYEYEALHTCKSLEYYRAYVVNITGNNPRRVPVVIEDTGILSNGYADPFFYNIHIFTNPPNFDYYLEGIEDWFRLVGIHEFTHISHMSRTNGISGVFTGIFGSFFQSNMYSPGWLIEGITVYTESQISPYEGRLNDGFFDAYLRLRVDDGRIPAITEATNEPFSFPSGKIYLYGGEFFEFLAFKYGDEKFARLFNVYGSYPLAPLSLFFPAIGLDRAAKAVYGQTFPALFSHWRKYLKCKKDKWKCESKRLTADAWYIYSMVSHKDKIYYVRAKPLKVNCFSHEMLVHIMEYDLVQRKEKIFATINSWLTTKMRLHKDNLYYCTAEIKRAKNVYLNGFGITSVLKRINLNDKKSEVLLKDDIRTFCVLSDSVIIYVKNITDGFGSEIWLYTPEFRKKLLKVDYLINDIETDGKWFVVSAKKQFENTDLYILDLESGNLYPITNTPWNEGSLYFIDKSQLGFVANYDGQHYVYSVNLDMPHQVFRYLNSGFVNSFIFRDSTLIFSGLNIDGFDIYEVKYQAVEYILENYNPAPKPDLDSLDIEIKHGNYLDILKTLYPSVRLPVFLPVDPTLKNWYYTAVIAGADATAENFYVGLFGYDCLNKKPLVITGFESRFLSPLTIDLFYNFNNSINISSSYPVFYSLNYGISQITTGIQFSSFASFTRKEISPEISLNARIPYSFFHGNFSIPIERLALNSSINRTGIRGKIGFNRIILNGQFKSQLSGLYDPQNPDTPVVSIRGYESIYTQKALILSTECSHKLFGVRKGLWNPNIYFEDLFGTLFFDYAILSQTNAIYSIGIALSLETKMCFNFLQFLPIVEIAVNRNKEIKLIFKINMSSPLFKKFSEKFINKWHDE